MPTPQVVERIEAQADSLYYHEHLARYRFAEKYICGGWTLDIATGTGYGADLLARHPDVYVVGADIEQQALQVARREYPDDRICFLTSDGCFMPFCDDSFQNIVTLETIEHISDDRGYLGELVRLLRFGGTCIISIPNREHSLRHNRKNPYHVREYSDQELESLLRDYFVDVDLFYQGFADRYYHQVQEYTEDIQVTKRRLNSFVQFGINHVYRPLKRLVPVTVTNIFIQILLNRTYPQPKLADIAISPKPLEDSSVFIAVCRHPRSKTKG